MRKVFVVLAALLSVAVEVVLAFTIPNLLQAWFGEGVAVVFSICIVVAVGVLLAFGCMGLNWFITGFGQKDGNKVS